MLARELVSLDRVVVIAHRGGSKLRPENTAAAFAHAVSLGVDAVECDVHLSRDGEVVVIHDDTLDRTTDAHGPVSAKTADELARVDAGYHFTADGSTFPFRGQGIGISRLADLLDQFPQIPWVIEVKGDRPDVGRRTVDVVRAARSGARVVVGGFSDLVLAAVRHAAPELLTSAASKEAVAAVRRALFGLGPKRPAFQLFQIPHRLNGKEIFRARFVRTMRRAGLPIQVWIVDDPTEMRQLLAWGVTGLITDRPDLAREIAIHFRHLEGGRQ